MSVFESKGFFSFTFSVQKREREREKRKVLSCGGAEKRSSLADPRLGEQSAYLTGSQVKPSPPLHEKLKQGALTHHTDWSRNKVLVAVDWIDEGRTAEMGGGAGGWSRARKGRRIMQRANTKNKQKAKDTWGKIREEVLFITYLEAKSTVFPPISQMSPGKQGESKPTLPCAAERVYEKQQHKINKRRLYSRLVCLPFENAEGRDDSASVSLWRNENTRSEEKKQNKKKTSTTVVCRSICLFLFFFRPYFNHKGSRLCRPDLSWGNAGL